MTVSLIGKVKKRSKCCKHIHSLNLKENDDDDPLTLILLHWRDLRSYCDSINSRHSQSVRLPRLVNIVQIFSLLLTLLQFPHKNDDHHHQGLESVFFAYLYRTLSFFFCTTSSFIFLQSLHVSLKKTDLENLCVAKLRSFSVQVSPVLIYNVLRQNSVWNHFGRDSIYYAVLLLHHFLFRFMFFIREQIQALQNLCWVNET